MGGSGNLDITPNDLAAACKPELTKMFPCLVCNRQFKAPDFNRRDLSFAVYRKFDYIYHLNMGHRILDSNLTERIYHEALSRSRINDNYNHPSVVARRQEIREITLLLIDIVQKRLKILLNNLQKLRSRSTSS